MNKTLATFLLLICSVFLVSGQEINYGLQFKSYEVEKEKRTSLNLTPEKPFFFPNGFSMSFDAKFDTDWLHPFGSVFRILTDDRNHIDLVLSEINNTGKTMVSFISSSHDILFSQAFDSIDIDYGKFIHFEITIDIRKNKVEAYVGDNKFTKTSSQLKDFESVNIVFGKSNYPRFQTTDVPAFSLKNLVINEVQGKALFSWPLFKHRYNGVYDDIKNHFASSDNGEWILDRHAIWQKRITIETLINPQFCYNPDDHEIAILDRGKFYRYMVKTNSLKQNLTNHQLIYTSSNSNNLIYNPETKTYNCYLLEMDEGKDVLLYDTLSQDWNKSYTTTLPPDYWHHNRVFSPIDKCLYMFFGYGHHRYKNEINRYDYETGKWEKLSFRGDRIQPRYLSGMGMLNDQYAIVFGGYGSETGNQNISPQSYYNLFRINLRTFESQKIWELKTPESEFAVAGTLIPDETGKSFYALAFNTQQFYTKLSLLEFSMEQPVYKVVADSIPFNFEDIKSNADMFFDKASGQLIAVVASAGRDNFCDLSIYTLSMPPLSLDNLYQDEKKQTAAFRILFVTGCCLFLILLVIFNVLRKKKNKLNEIKEEMPVHKEQVVSYEDPQCSAIYLFGGFQVSDKDGRDITREFTPMLRQLFILLLLYTVKNGKGISSVKLKDLLWYDKSEGSAKNNRGGFMNKLRLLFEHIGTLNIRNQDIYWSIELGEEIYCDYMIVLSVMDRISSNIKSASKDDIQSLLKIISKGELLPNIQTEWIDSFKSDFSNQLIDLLLDIYQQSNTQKHPQTCISLADAVFMHDSLNEDALSIKCRNLVLMGKYGLAKKAYTIFIKEYKVLFNTDFDYSFEEVIRSSKYQV